jgi:hypothetical protein
MIQAHASYESFKREWMQWAQTLAFTCVRAQHDPSDAQVPAVLTAAAGGRRCPAACPCAAVHWQPLPARLAPQLRLRPTPRLLLPWVQAAAELLDATARTLAFFACLGEHEEFTQRAAAELLQVEAILGPGATLAGHVNKVGAPAW